MNSHTGSAAGASEWRSGWPVTLSAALGMAVSVMHIYSLGVFIEPLEREFGWSRADISAGPAIVSVLFVIASPLVGMVLDRASARTVALPGLAIYCTGFALLGTAGPSIWGWWTGWLLLAAGAALTSATVWTLGVARRFRNRRGLALALTLAGTGFCSMLLPGAANFLIDHFGWRMAYVTLACVAALVAMPTTALLFNDGGGSAGHAKKSMVADGRLGVSVQESLLSARFGRLGLASLLVVIGSIALLVHFVPILVERGLNRGSAVVIAGLVGLSSIVGRIATGFVLDRFHGGAVGAIAFAAPAGVCLLLLQPDVSAVSATIAAVGLGLALGAEIDVVAYLTTRYFGLSHYGVLFGVINVLLKIGSGFGPLVGGIVYDRCNSYTPLITGLIVSFAISAVLMLSLGQYPELERKQERAADSR